MNTKQCSKCAQVKPVDEFSTDRTKASGYKSRCKECRRADDLHRRDGSIDIDVGDLGDDERARRRASDFETLQPLDFEDDTSISNDDSAEGRKAASQASREKRQEYNRSMGMFAQDLRDAAVQTSRNGSMGQNMPAEHAEYIRQVAEQERRFGNRRWARSIALAEAHEQLSREAFVHVAEKYFKDKVRPAGYAAIPSKASVSKRTVCLLLSDLHIGSELDSLDEPVSFTATQEARRLEFLLRQLIDFKPQYRDKSEALVILNGDLIEGQLMHDFRAGSPLVEQKVVFWKYFQVFISTVAQHYPKVRVVCQPGNHGRDKVRHPGRATARRWDGHEWEMMYALQQMCSGLLNVEWQLDFRGVSIVDLYGQKLGVTHGDAEVKLSHPDAGAKNNSREFDRINSTRLWGCEFNAWVVGHFHTPRFHPGNPRVLYNGALVPPNGYARASGYLERQGQWLFESVEGHVVGDLRFIEVGSTQDNDNCLGSIIKPFRFSQGD